MASPSEHRSLPGLVLVPAPLSPRRAGVARDANATFDDRSIGVSAGRATALPSRGARRAAAAGRAGGVALSAGESLSESS
jgi:hypothetical protein